MNEKWLEWAKELQFLAQAGLTESRLLKCKSILTSLII